MKTRDDVVREYCRAMQSMSLANLRQLQRFGILLTAITRVCPVPMRVQPRGRLYVPDPAGAPGWVLPVCAADADDPDMIECDDPETVVATGVVIDLIVFSPAAPGRWALRLGQAGVLGAIGPQYCWPDPVAVCRDITEWLRNDCVGIVLLTADRRRAAGILRQCIKVEAEDSQHAAELRSFLRAPIIDRVMVAA
jgi:hypothetical protein